MAASFGFSVGDFIAAIKLIIALSDELRASGRARSHHERLLHRLSNLERILTRVKALNASEGCTGEMLAIRQTADLCARDIEEFSRKAQKYGELSYHDKTLLRKIPVAWRRIQWALFEKKDMDGLCMNLERHMQYLQVPLDLLIKYSDHISHRYLLITHYAGKNKRKGPELY